MTKTDNSAAGHRKRLRDKFMKSSLAGFHDYEAIELLLTYAVPRRDVKPPAKELLRRFKTMSGVFDAGYEELSAISGIGERSALVIMLVKGAMSAYLAERSATNKPISSAEDVVRYMNERVGDDGVEKFYALYLNAKNEIIDAELLCSGDDMRSNARPVIDAAFRHNARSIIFVHRKATVGRTLSRRDEALIRPIEKAAKAVDILVHDYIVITKDSHESGLQRGWIKGR